MFKPLMILILFFKIDVEAQIHYYSDCYKGGVVGDGYCGWFLGGIGQIQLPIPSGSLIKKAFLFSNLYKSSENAVVSNKIIEINNQPLVLSENYIIGNSIYFPSMQCYVSPVALDITSHINPSITSYTINTFSDNPPIITPLFSDFFIFVLYENATFNNIGVEIYINNEDVSPNVLYNLAFTNPFINNCDVGLSINTSSICDNPDDWYKISINSNLIGGIGGKENNSNVNCSGAIGSFYYQNSQLFGIGNDTSNTSMHGLDAVSNIVSLISNQQFYLKFEYASNLEPYSNLINQITLAYSTPCQPFNVSVSNDTVVCAGEAVQLHASGGVQYEWLPHQNLSCYTCANPVFTGDSSQFYSVRIWNNDSCSVVRPVMVRVRPKPTFSNLSSSPSVCGGSTGSIVAVSPSASNYSLDNTAWQASGSFSNLQAGNYTVYVTDTNGCVGDSTLSVSEQTTVNAQFTATPSTGTVPLSVALSNQSTNYTNLEWFVDGVSQGANFSEFLAGQSGVYDIELVAWQNNSTCADTFSLQISAYDSLLISIPNIVTPNQDGINDYFSIQCNQPLNITYSILNRWGNELTTGTLNKQQGNVVLWNISDEVTDGVYFYKITFSSENPQIQQQLEQLGAVKNGFVEVVR